MAVVSIILYHARYPLFRGGFIGVDVFFVISGYLITSVILVKLETGTFSLGEFYERRARRILPALFLIMAACIPFAWLWQMPSDMKEFCQSVVATSAFASNLLFWRESGYFDTAGDLKPLLHTWSLAVEEQYYLLFPVFLLLTWRLGRRRIVGLLILICLLSLVTAQWGTYNAPRATFFLLPTRFWELGSGALIGFYIAQRQQLEATGIIRQLASLAGILLILLSVFAYSVNTPFPGLYAVPPTFGTALIIVYATPRTYVGQILGTRAFVRVGLISYSAYLWHQPLFAFTRIITPAGPNSLALLFITVATFGLAYFSWRFVEQPFRQRQLITRGMIIKLSVFGTIAFALFGYLGNASDGFRTNRFSIADLRKLASYDRSNSPFCEIANCSLKKAAGDDWLLIGDSNAYHFSKPLDEIVTQRGHHLYNLSIGGCVPISNVEREDRKKAFNDHCNAYYSRVRKYALSRSSPNNIVISAAWGLYVYGSKYNYSNVFAPFNKSQIYPVGQRYDTDEQRISAILILLREEIETYARSGKKIVLIGPIPYLESEPLRNRIAFANGVKPFRYDLFMRANSRLLNLFDTLGRLPNVTVFRPDKSLCIQSNSEVCLNVFHGSSLYGDRTHLSDFGARWVFGRFFRQVVR